LCKSENKYSEEIYLVTEVNIVTKVLLIAVKITVIFKIN